MSWATMQEALAAFRRNEFVLVMDADDREDECDLIIAAENITTAQMAFLIRYGTGIACVVADKQRLENFGLHPATTANTDVNGTNFYVSTDFIPGTTTGVSASDRAITVRAMCDMSHPPESFSKPGHIFPLCARPGGVLERPGHTESCYDLCRLSGVKHVGVIVEMMHEDGTMFRRGDSLKFAEKYGIPIITVDQIIEYCKSHPPDELNTALANANDSASSEMNSEVEAKLNSLFIDRVITSKL
jgi:3,4-dihydroxy 2-butanone 4-phosphate synthase/GTP cyclohydrolase II